MHCLNFGIAVRCFKSSKISISASRGTGLRMSFGVSRMASWTTSPRRWLSSPRVRATRVTLQRRLQRASKKSALWSGASSHKHSSSSSHYCHGDNFQIHSGSETKGWIYCWKSSQRETAAFNWWTLTQDLSRLTRASPTTTCGIIWSSPRRVTAKHLNRSTSCWHRCQLKLNNLKWWMKEIFSKDSLPSITTGSSSHVIPAFVSWSRKWKESSVVPRQKVAPPTEKKICNRSQYQSLAIPKPFARNTKVLAARTSALQPERVSGEQIVMQHGFNPQIWGRPSRLVSPIKDTKLTRNLAFKPIFPLLLLFELWTYHLWNILSVQSGRTIHLPFINAPKQYDYVEAY